MRVTRTVLILMLLSLLWGTVAPAAAAPGLRQEEPEAADANDYPILSCTATGTGGDLADTRGIRFTVSQSFSAVEVRMAATTASGFTITAELRRSTGFTGDANYVKTVETTIPTSNATPYKPVKFDFGNVPVSGSETFTLRFVNIAGQGSLFFETYGINNKPCASVEETEENNVANPLERGDPAGFKVLAPGSASLSLTSVYVSTPPTIDGSIGWSEWNNASRIPFENGFITVLNDSLRLYVLIDVLDDPVNNTGRAMDSFWLAFDKDRNNAITPNVDLLYGLDPGTGNMRYSFFVAPAQFTGLQPETFSSKGRGFGCFFGDGTLTFTFNPFRLSCHSHVVWEFGIDLAEIGAQAGGSARMGARIASVSPAFENRIPSNLTTDLSNYINVSIAASPFLSIVPNPAASITLDAKAIEITQAIQNRDNTLPLVDKKTTAARVYVDVNGVATRQPAKAYLYGSVGGVDLPGSPLATMINAPTSIDRNKLGDTANFLLPASWSTGTVTFRSKAADMFGNAVASVPFNKGFSPRDVPVVWIVPVNTGTNSSPVLVSNTQISSQESAMKAVYPAKDITFVQKSWTVIGPTSVANTIDALNQYFNSAVLAWLISVIFTGKQPFTLPDQVYGFTPTGGGISDPTWIGGNGYVARGFIGTSGELTMAHEINHNLDRSSSGTWGRHVGNPATTTDSNGNTVPVNDPNWGCGAAGPDPNWPRNPNHDDMIFETGFDTRLPWVDTASQDTVVNGNFPDFMSYCQSGQLPTKWISPYRWNNIFNRFPTSMNASMLELAPQATEVFYVSGLVNKDDTGNLNPVLQGPGIPTNKEEVAPGDYAIEVRDASDVALYTLPFMVSFVDVEGEPVDTVYFNFQVPFFKNATKVVLTHGEKVLANLQQTPHAPTVTVTAPNGGEEWSGTQNVQSSASDADGDPLTFTVLYTPDNGASWFPVASGVSGNSLDVDFGSLPGGAQAKIRVIASDGFLTGQDDSDAAFTVANSGPVLTIDRPLENDLYPSGEVLLQGDAVDPESGPVADEAMVWLVDDQPVGSGRSATASLSAGEHKVTLTAQDSLGMSSEKSVVIFVGGRLFFPYVQR